ncbi:hypothetical protein CY35_16G047700 [Sphagnum magellanicum]|nr:hypothetical protein CY35_16G047700 [Sphagnum magellanicum]
MAAAMSSSLSIPHLAYSLRPRPRSGCHSTAATTQCAETRVFEAGTCDSLCCEIGPAVSGGKLSRRRASAAAAAAAALWVGLFFIPGLESQAAEGGGGGPLSKYIKRKKLDPLETYVPTVVLAQRQFEDVGGILVREKPEFSDARSLLRSGPAGSLRTDIRAVAQYAAEAGEGKAATDAVEQCLSALEDLDSLLIRASRSESSASVDTMKDRVSAAVTALDRLLATVPSPVLEKGKAIATAYMDQSATFDEANPDSTVIQGGDSELLKALFAQGCHETRGAHSSKHNISIAYHLRYDDKQSL